MGVIGIVATALASAGSQPAYPAEAVYAAFTDACADVADLDRARASLAGKGWEEYQPAADSETGRIIDRGRSMLAESAPTTKLRPMTAFRRDVAGEHLELVLSGVEMGHQWINGCRVYDFHETRSIPPAMLERKFGRAPDEKVEEPDILVKSMWEPGYRPDHLSTELYFVPEGSPVISLIGANGICIVAQASGELQ